jgi:hypothetical protein
LVLRAEAKTEEALGEIKRALADTLRRVPQIGPVSW